MNVDGYIGKRDGSTRCWGGELHKSPECQHLPDPDEGAIKPVNSEDFPHKEWCKTCSGEHDRSTNDFSYQQSLREAAHE